ncbi:MAG: Crp/Fnr family transcriptional regulator [Anaerolineae bacterium]|nr:Crp/Fnr family transcriptional regulator [Anaerolineae bacterium]
MVSSVKHYISSISYFEGLTEGELDYIVANSVSRRYEASEIIFLEGDPADGLWIVEEGRLKVHKLHPEGGEHILHMRGPGNTFNDIAALDGGNNPANATALSQNVHLWLVPTDIIAHILSTNPQIALNVIRLLARRVRSLVGQIEDLALYSVIVRLARFLLKQTENPNLSGPGITRTAIAAHLNTTPQTISVALRELEAAEAIEFDRHRIVILAEDKLRSIALL